MEADTTTITLETADAVDELTVPTELIALLDEDGDGTVPEVVGDVAMMGLAQRIHGAVHHAEGDPSEDIAEVDRTTMELFEERFGTTFAQMTGHDH